jgi:hypothetical protein
LRPGEIASRWFDAFNSGDPDAMVGLYAEDAVHTSPKLKAADPATGGRLVGRAALRHWWSEAMAKRPPISYELITLIEGDDVVAIEYLRHRQGEATIQVVEVFEIRDGKIVRSNVYHG